MCVCLTINARKKFRIKNLHTLPNKTDGYAAMFLLQCGVDIFVGITIYQSHKRSFRPVRGNTPNHPITYSRPSQLSPGSTRPGSTHSPLCQLVPCVNSSSSQLVPESTRPRVNSSPGQLEPGSTNPGQLVPESSQSQLVPVSTRPGSTRPRVNSSPCHTSSPSQLVPESTRLRVNSSSSQLVPGSTRPRVNSRLHLSLVNLHPRQLAPTSTRTRVIPQPSQLAPRSTRTQVPAYHTTHLLIYLHNLPPT